MITRTKKSILGKLWKIQDQLNEEAERLGIDPMDDGDWEFQEMYVNTVCSIQNMKGSFPNWEEEM